MESEQKGRFVFTNKTYGLPDSVVLGENGRPQEHVLRQSLGLTRNQGQAIKKDLNKGKVWSAHSKLKTQFVAPRLTIINRYADPDFRAHWAPPTARKLLLESIRKSSKDSSDKFPKQSTFSLSSWELLTLHRYAPEMWEVKVVEDASDESEATKQDAESSESLEDLVLEKVNPIVSEIATKATQELSDWGTFPNTKKIELAEVVFAIGSYLDIDFLNEATESQPELLAYYSLITSNKYNQEVSNSVSTKGSPSQDDSLSVEIDSPDDIYEELEKLLGKAKAYPLDSSIAPELARLAQSVVDWFDKHPQLIPLVECMESLVSTLYSLGKDSSVRDFCDEDFAQIFASNWHSYIGSSTTNEIDEDLLLKHITTGEEIVNRQSTTLKNLTSEEQALRSRHKELSEKEPTKRSERRLIDDEIDEILIQIQERKSRRREVSDEILVALLPPGCNLELYENLEGINPPAETDVSSSMRIALDRAYRFIESGELPQDTGGSDESEDSIKATENLDYEDLDPNWLDPVDSKSVKIDDITKDSEDQSETDETSSDSLEEREPSPIEEAEASVELEHQKEGELKPPMLEESSSAQEQIHVESDHLELSESEVSYCSQCINQLNDNGSIEDAPINFGLIKLVELRRIPYSIGLATLVEDNSFAANIVPSTLLKSAYFGQNTWGFGRALSQSRDLLATFTPSLIDQWMELDGAGKIIPFLVFVSCFKPALIGGNYSNAPSLLASVKTYFSEPTQRLINDTVDLANKNKVVSLSKLQSNEDNGGESQTNFAELLDSWSQRIKNTKKGYAPILKAQSYCIDKGLFKKIADIIKANDQKKIEIVEEFINSHRDRESTDALLNELIVATGQDIPPGAILVQGRSRFFHKVNELTEIAQSWVGKTQEQGDEIDRFGRKFSTLLPQAHNSFRKISQDTDQSIERRAGASIAAEYLNDLQKVIDGNESSIWESERIGSWLDSPNEIIRTRGESHNPIEELTFFLSQIDEPLAYGDVIKQARDQSNFSLAYLIYLYLRDTGDDRKRLKEQLEEQITGYRSKFRRTLSHLENQIDSAVLSSLIKPERGEMLVGEIGGIEEAIDSLKKYSSTFFVEKQISKIRDEISNRTADKLTELEDSYRAELEQFQAAINEPIPEDWIQTMESSISSENFPVIEEMLDELQSSRREGLPIRFSPIEESPILRDFLNIEDKVYKRINELSDQRIIWSAICESDNNSFGLDFSNKFSLLKKTVESFCAWNNRQTRCSLDPRFYESVVTILRLIGLEAIDKVFRRGQKSSYSFNHGEGFVSLYVRIKSTETRRPFPFFGEAGVISQPIIIATQNWSPEKLDTFMQSMQLMGSKPILISGVPLSNKQRNKFASYFKSSKSAIFHIDLVMALFLGCLQRNSADKSAIRNFLWLSVPWSYFNPYVAGGTTFPPPYEMRYGRRTEINRLLEMNNGHAIVFGGRQLGKSTIVQEVRRNFSKTKQKQFAYYHLLDKNMDRMGISKDDWENARNTVWSNIYGDLEKAGLVEKLDGKADAEQLSHEVENSLLSNPDYKVIVIFDEIDPILNVDNAHDFAIFRGIRELVSKPGIHGRFKLIIAGLENVKRFENSPNYPLHQMGGSLQVSIMSTQDALHLIREPLFAAGYTFESAQVANRILSITNRHPGIIQVFCHELISYLVNKKRASVGAQVINDEDINFVHQKQEVIDLIRTRFDMTLNLDRRYLIIIYGLLSEGKGSRAFSVKEAFEIAKVWLPEEFGNISAKQFEAFLIELCGLGVLKAIKEGRTNQYVLRNYNILKLIGNDEDEINDKLSMALRQHTQNSPLDRHAFFEIGIPACPITFGDEKEILTGDSFLDTESEVEEFGSWKFTSTLIVGSEALGLHELENTLPYLYEIERLSHPELKPAKKYELLARSDREIESPEKFEKILNGMLENRALQSPIMLMIRISGDRDLAHLLGMIDASSNLRTIDMETKYPVRVIFTLGPKAYWQWLSNPLLTSGRELTQPFIHLAPWGTSAISHFLSKLGIGNAPGDVDKLLDHTQGWYLSLNILRKIIQENRKISNLSKLPPSYVHMLSIEPKQSKGFLQSTGLKEVDWANPLLIALKTYWGGEGASLDEIQLTIQEERIFGDVNPDVNSVVEWLTAMNLLKRSRKSSVRQISKFQVNTSILHALEVENVG